MDPSKAPTGRPRSERARSAILHAADDLLVEGGYAAMTMKGIADRAGVGRQTVYRWWSSKAEVLLEASAEDAAEELAIDATGGPEAALAAYLHALVAFLTTSAAGSAYRALLGEAQHDPAVAELLAGRDVIGDAARTVLVEILGADTDPVDLDRGTTLLIGPTFYWLMTGGAPSAIDPPALARSVYHELLANVTT